jgi:hypothetical protein
MIHKIDTEEIIKLGKKIKQLETENEKLKKDIAIRNLAIVISEDFISKEKANINNFISMEWGYIFAEENKGNIQMARIKFEELLSKDDNKQMRNEQE